jgi:hypothetical protein
MFFRNIMLHLHVAGGVRTFTTIFCLSAFPCYLVERVRQRDEQASIDVYFYSVPGLRAPFSR